MFGEEDVIHGHENSSYTVTCTSFEGSVFAVKPEDFKRCLLINQECWQTHFRKSHRQWNSHRNSAKRFAGSFSHEKAVVAQPEEEEPIFGDGNRALGGFRVISKTAKSSPHSKTFSNPEQSQDMQQAVNVASQPAK